MIRITVHASPTPEQLAAITAYSKTWASSSFLNEVTCDLSEKTLIQKICPDATFSVIGTGSYVCIVQTSLDLATLQTNFPDSAISVLGRNVYRIDAIDSIHITSLLNSNLIDDIQLNDTTISLLSLPLSPTVWESSPGVTIDLAAIAPTTAIAVSDNWALSRIFNRVLPGETQIGRLTPINRVVTNVYLMDSGVNSNHIEFNNNVQNLFTIAPPDYTDHNGHGTSLASAIVGATVGVVPEYVIIQNVKILDSTRLSTLEDVIAGFNSIIEYVVLHPTEIHVVNMSWVIMKNTIIESIIQGMIDTLNIKFVCAAGNSGQPIELLTPASMRTVLTVGAIDLTSTLCGFTNYNNSVTDTSLPLFTQTAVDIFAPGENVTTADYMSTTGYKVTAGTSVASAYVSAVAAYTTLLKYPAIQSQSDLFLEIVSLSTKEAITVNDAKFALMPNRIIWCLNSCPEINSIPNLTINHTDSLTYSYPLIDPTVPVTDLAAFGSLATVVPDTFEERKAAFFQKINAINPNSNAKWRLSSALRSGFSSDYTYIDVVADSIQNGVPTTIYVRDHNYFSKNTITISYIESPLTLAGTYTKAGQFVSNSYCWVGTCDSYTYSPPSGCYWSINTYQVTTIHFPGTYTNGVYQYGASDAPWGTSCGGYCGSYSDSNCDMVP